MIIDDKEPNCYNINVIWNVKIFLNSRKASLKVNDNIPAEKIWIYLIRALSEEGWRMSIVQPCTICRPFWKTKLGQGLYILTPFLGITSLMQHHLNFSEKGKLVHDALDWLGGMGAALVWLQYLGKATHCCPLPGWAPLRQSSVTALKMPIPIQIQI